MKSVWFFIKTTIKGGVLFFLPLIFLYIIIEKVVDVFTKIISPVAVKFGIDNIAGKATISIFIALLVLLICFVGGLLMRLKQLEKLNNKLDEKLTAMLPSYKKIKVTAAKQLDELDNKFLRTEADTEKEIL